VDEGEGMEWCGGFGVVVFQPGRRMVLQVVQMGVVVVVVVVVRDC
jgi:hypothetical protein